VARGILRHVTLRIHRAERTDLLADGLADMLAEPLADPFAEEVVVVPARGVERWLTQRLSHRLGAGPRGGDGVCAGVRFLSPHSLVAMLLGKERDDPWEPDRLVWPLLEVIDDSLDEPWCRTLATHLGHGGVGDDAALRRSRRYSVARRLAGLFASYAVQRPRLVTDWRAGRDSDGAGGCVDEDLSWQPELWRRLIARVGATPPDLRHAQTVARLREGRTDGLELPPRLSLFGHTRLPVTEVELLSALGRLRDVHLWLPQVSQPLWEELAEMSSGGPVSRAEDTSIRAVGHPLLGSLGRDARELQRTLAVAGGEDSGGVVATSSTTRTLLGWLQADLRANREPDAATRAGRVVQPEDRSVQVHACHGATRQVDVLREVLVGLLQDDPTLEPRDILVMCPDIEAYAPLIQAGFGLSDLPDADEGHPGHRLRLRLADRALSSTNPLLAVAGTLVELAGGRATATEVLDLAAAQPVRRRFGFTDDDLAQLALWVEEASIRWGFDAEHRASYGLGLPVNTWQGGLSRILLGVAAAEDGQVAGVDVLPVDDVSSGDLDLAGRFAEYVERLRGFVATTESAASIGGWVRALSQGVARLTDVGEPEAWQRAQFDRELARIGDSAVSATGGNASPPEGDGLPLMLADVRNLLAHRLGGRPTRANFRTGTLTVCTMVPMRSVPHRVVCLLGLDDGVFPRAGSVDGDDVLARNPMTGERDVRSEDRQLFLDAILAAKETLVVTYTGANEHTGAPRPPAVPLGELLDALERTAVSTVRDHVLIEHPLQPFDPRNLIPGELVGARPFSFDRTALAGARAARSPREHVRALVTEPLPPRPRADVALADLQAFLAHPARAFLRSRLDVSSPLEAEEIHDAIPITLDGLAKWEIGDRMLQGILAGVTPDAAARAERMRGRVPPGRLGARTLQEVDTELRGLVRSALALRGSEGFDQRVVDVDIDLGDGRRLTGTVPSVYGNRLVTVTYSRLAAKHRLRSWVDLLALSAGHPDEHWTAHALGRGRSATAAAQAGPLDHRAREWLRELVDLYDRGMREPVPMPAKTACAWAEESLRRRRTGNGSPRWKAKREWETDPFSPTAIPGEHADAAHVQVYGEAAPLDCLLTEPRADERWDAEEPHRLGQYAWRLWRPLLEGAEKVGHL
jgi:exodeoxyribonuclease V gamma subunit